jgi:hypothetical protein
MGAFDCVFERIEIEREGTIAFALREPEVANILRGIAK